MVERPKKIQYVGGFYNEKELAKLFDAVKGDPIELGVIVAAFYGLRRSEVVGLKWDAIDFVKKTVTIRHTVTQMCLDGKSTVIQKDRTKTKSSYRTLPLVEPFEELLLRLKEQQTQNRKLCGRSYNNKYSEYIYILHYVIMHILFTIMLTILPKSAKIIMGKYCLMQGGDHCGNR